MQEISNARLANRSMAFVLAGGRGSRLMELTEKRAKPAVYFGGKSRIIDFALSNALNAGIRKMAVATQYKAHSLIRHMQRGWNFFRAERNEYLDILPASQRKDLTPVYGFNSLGIWVGGARNPASREPESRLSRWRDLLRRAAEEGLG